MSGKSNKKEERWIDRVPRGANRVGPIAFMRGRRKPGISRRAAAEMLNAKMAPVAVAQALYGGPEWLPLGYKDADARADLEMYIKQGTMRKRWTDMELKLVPSQLRIAWRMGMSDDTKRMVTLIAWLGGAKSARGLRGAVGQETIKRAYKRAVDPREHPGTLQRVFEAYDKSPDKSIGGGKAFFHLLKIGDTARLVNAGSTVEGIVKRAINQVNESDKLRKEVQLQKMTVSAYEKAANAHKNSVENLRVAALGGHLEGLMKRQDASTEFFDRLIKEGRATEKDREHFFTVERKEFEARIKALKADGVSDKVLQKLKEEMDRVYQSAFAGSPGALQAAKQEALRIISGAEGAETIGVLLKAGLSQDAVDKLIDKSLPESERKAIYLQPFERQARATWQIFNQGTIDVPLRDSMLKRLQKQATQPIQFSGDGDITHITTDDFDAFSIKHRGGVTVQDVGWVNYYLTRGVGTKYLRWRDFQWGDLKDDIAAAEGRIAESGQPLKPKTQA